MRSRPCLRARVVVCAALLLSPTPVFGYPGEWVVARVRTAGSAAARAGMCALSAINDVRTRSGIRRIPLIGKFWRPEPGEIPPETYNQLFPHYIQVCTMTQYIRVERDENGKIIERKEGGWGGHATMFINGACLDNDVTYPRLTLCEDEEGLARADSGIGVSVNQVFKNVNWMAFPGREFFLHGEVPVDELLDGPRFEHAVQHAARSRLFDEIEMHDHLREDRPGGISEGEHLIRESIGTDFALSLARTAFCARLPLPKEVLLAVIGKLNALNEQYALTGKPYQWDLYQDNCSHAVHNAIAASGLWDAKRTRLGNLRQFVRENGWHLSFPFNTVVRLAEAGNQRPIDNVMAAFRNHDIRSTFERFGWISTGHGALVETHAIRPVDRNRLFIEGAMPFAGSLPFDLPKAIPELLSGRIISTLNKEKQFRRFFSRDEYRDILENLYAYRARYEETLVRAQDPAESYRSYRRMDKDEKREFRDFKDRFFKYIEDRLVDVNHKIQKYRAISGDASQP